ncbi:uncharacterized protein Gasu_37850 [Galdieria sulphuraria]|uniref:Uncharacterized protein n=1 Tax=Galdieria sulphuraria TaxID=130081 RepID=M2XYV8_GALSU|nr:uncharacterized protein Gasu_37850 [Galdieria sulphuraria]EME28734.1 hypothetical protein Gasu_37850 [Galdieria sulphuraria]|eukprot:XP_005705254.1 hypothetical protein Gasu_37850 [Galdieria sulphuraria]
MQTEKEENTVYFPRKQETTFSQGENSWRKMQTGASSPLLTRDTSSSTTKKRNNVDLKIRIPSTTSETTHSWSSPIGEGRPSSSRVARAVIEPDTGERKADSKSEQYEGYCGSPYLSELGRLGSSTALLSWSNDRTTERKTASAKDWEAYSPVLAQEPKAYSASYISKGGRARSPFRTNSTSDSVALTDSVNNTTFAVNNDMEVKYRLKDEETKGGVDKIVSDESERNCSKMVSVSASKHRRQGSGTSISSRKTLTEHSPLYYNNETSNLDDWIGVVQERKRQASEIKSAFDELARDLDYFRKAREEDDSYLSIVRERLESLDLVSSEKATLCEKLMDELAQMDAEMAKLEENVAEYGKAAAREETQRLGAAKAMSLLENHLKALNVAIEAETTLADALERRLQVAKTGISLFSGPDAKQRYEVALKTIEDDSASLRSAHERCNHAREELKRLKEQKDLIIPVIERAEQMKKEYQEAESEAQCLEQEVFKLRQELQTLDENFDSLDRVLEDCEFRSSQATSRIATASKLKEKLVSDCSSKAKLLEVLKDQCEEIRFQAVNKESTLSQMETFNAHMESALAQANEVISVLSKAIADSKNSSRNTSTSASKTESISSSDRVATYSPYNSADPTITSKSQRKRRQSPTKPPKPPKSSEAQSHSTQESVLETDDVSTNQLDIESPLVHEGDANTQVNTTRKKVDDRGGTGADMLRSVGTTRSMNGVFDRLEPSSSHYKSSSAREQASASGASSSVRGSIVNTVSSDWAYPLSSTTRNDEQRKQSSVTSPPYPPVEHASAAKNVQAVGDEISQSAQEVSWDRVYIHGEFYNSRTLFASPFEDIREAELYMDRDRVSNNVIIGWYRLPRGSNMIDRTALRTVGMQYVTTADDIGHRLVVEIQLKESSRYNNHMSEGERPNAVTDIISTDPEMDRKVSQWISEGQKAFLVEDELTGERRGIFLSSTKLKVQKQTSHDRNNINATNTSSSSIVEDVGGIWITEEKKSWAADPGIRLDDMDPLSFQLTLTHTFVFRAATSEQRDLIAICIRRFYSRFFALQRTRKVNCQFQ